MFLQKLLPEYKVLSEQLKKFVTDPIIIAKFDIYLQEREAFASGGSISGTNGEKKLIEEHHQILLSINNTTNGSSPIKKFSPESIKEPVPIIKLQPPKKKSSSFPVSTKISSIKENNNNNKSKQISPPNILSISPAVVPTSFGDAMIDIRGTGFVEGLELYIAGIKIPADLCLVEKGEGDLWHIFVDCPVCNEEGPKTVIVINPDKKTSILKDILLYVNDSEILKEFQKKILI